MRPAGKSPPPPEAYQARLDLFRDLIVAGMTRHLVYRAVQARTTPGPEDLPETAEAKRELAKKIGAPLTERAARATYARVLKDMADEFEDDRGTARAAQAARLQHDLLTIRSEIEGSARSQAGGAQRARLYLAAQRHEALLADVLGTRAPTEIRLDATVEARRSLIAVVMNMSTEEQEKAILEEEERERLAPAEPLVSSMRRERL